jgi:hypothetical protein
MSLGLSAQAPLSNGTVNQARDLPALQSLS